MNEFISPKIVRDYSDEFEELMQKHPILSQLSCNWTGGWKHGRLEEGFEDFEVLMDFDRFIRQKRAIMEEGKSEKEAIDKIVRGQLKLLVKKFNAYVFDKYNKAIPPYRYELQFAQGVIHYDYKPADLGDQQIGLRTIARLRIKE